MPFFDNHRQAISTFIKSLHARPAIIFVADEASISPLLARPMSNVERKIDIEARGIRTRQKSGLRICKNESSTLPIALTYNGGCRHIYAGRVVTLCGRGEIKK